MAFHHLPLATNDLLATHRFSTEAMGFTLVHVEDGTTDLPGAWFRHALFDTGDGSLLAFMELHDDRCTDFDPAISRGLGLPSWVNHLAFEVDGLDALDDARDRWLRCGLDVVRIQHHHCTSVHTDDPNGTLVEWACPTRAFSDIEFFLAVDHA